MRHVKRAVRADLHRFKAFIEMQETESGAWRGTIEDGEVKRSSSSDDSRAKRNRTSSGQAKPARSTSRRSPSSLEPRAELRRLQRRQPVLAGGQLLVARAGRGPDDLARPRLLGARGDRRAGPRASPERAASGRPD